MNEFIKTQNQKISDYDADLSKFLEAESNRQEAVSYTHLTLPTRRFV